jgi:hypothetical protein
MQRVAASVIQTNACHSFILVKYEDSFLVAKGEKGYADCPQMSHFADVVDEG